MTFSVKDKVCQWALIPQFPTIKARESHAAVALLDKYLFLYGGCDDEIIYDDYWVFNTDLDIWFEITDIKERFEKRLNSSFSLIGEKIFVFGGQLENQNYQSSLYLLQFSELQFTAPNNIPSLACSSIIPKGKAPYPRSGHASTVYNNRYIFILGGQSEGIAKGKKSTILLNDVWSYDCIQNTWLSIEIPNRNIFKPRSYFTASIFRNQIFVFGGLISIQNFRSSDELLIFSFLDQTNRKLEICNLCKLSAIQADETENKKDIAKIIGKIDNFSLNIKSLFKLGRCIQTPLQGFSLIIEAFNCLFYKSLTIQVSGSKIIIFQGAGHTLNYPQFAYFFSNFRFVDQIQLNDSGSNTDQTQDKQNRLALFSSNIKNGSVRLGNCVIFINKRNNFIDLLLFQNQSVFVCEVDVSDFSVPQSQAKAYEIIQSYLISLNVNITLIAEDSFTIVVSGGQHIQSGQLQPCHLPFIASYISRMFLWKPDIEIILNKQVLQFLEAQDIPEFQTLLSVPKMRIRIKQNERKECNISVIRVYRANILVYQYQDKKDPCLEGTIQIQQKDFKLNLLRTKLESQSKSILKQHISEICQQFRSSAGKRETQNGNQLNQLGNHEAHKKLKESD